MSEDSDSSSLASCTKGGTIHYKGKYSDSDEESQSRDSFTITKSKKQSTLFSFVVSENKPNDKSLEYNDDNSESSSKSLDNHETVFDDNDVANRSNSISLRKKSWIC